MLFTVYLGKEFIADKVRLVKANNKGVALKDDTGATKVIDDVYISEIEGVIGFIILRRVGTAVQGL